MHAQSGRRRRIRSGAALAAAVLVGATLVVAGDAFAAGGDPDTDFGISGVGSFPGNATIISETAGDNLFVLTGETENWKLTKYLSNGTGVDTDFGTNGVATPTADMVAGGDDDAFFPFVIIEQPDGSVVLAGDSHEADGGVVSVARYTDEGDPDATFGTNGYKVTTIEGTAIAVKIAPDNKIVLGVNDLDDRGSVARLATNGTPDSGFGTAGLAHLTGFGAFCALGAIAVQSDLAVVGAGNCDDDSDLWKISRVDEDGAADNFGGTPITAPGPDDSAVSFVSDVGIDADGGVYVAAITVFVTPLPGFDIHTDNWVGRYAADGGPLAGFGTTGRVRVSPSAFDVAESLLFDGAGGLLVVGATGEDIDHADFTITRIDAATGALDCGFGGNGSVYTSIGGYSPVYMGALDSNGRVVIAGGSGDDVDDVAFARYLAPEDEPESCTPDVTPPTGVKVSEPTKYFTLSKAPKFKWTANDPSGIDHFDLQLRLFPYNTNSTAWDTVPQSIAREVTLDLNRGDTVCMKVRAADFLLNTSNYSAPVCTAVPLSTDQMSFSSGWARVNFGDAYTGVVRRTTTNGKVATRTNTRFQRLYLVATTCANCGEVTVALNGKNIKTVSLKSSTTKRKQLIPIAIYGTTHTGTVTVKVTSPTGKTVTLEGLGLYRD